MNEYKENDIIEGTVIQIKPFGAIMLFEDGTRGLLHISEITNAFIRNIKRYLKIGKTYQVKVVGIKDDGFLKVSMNKITPEEKEEYRTSGVKKNPINPENVDFTALKEHLVLWTSEEKEGE